VGYQLTYLSNKVWAIFFCRPFNGKRNNNIKIFCHPGGRRIILKYFATQVAEGAKGPEDCLPLDDANREGLSSYLGRFCFDF